MGVDQTTGTNLVDECSSHMAASSRKWSFDEALQGFHPASNFMGRTPRRMDMCLAGYDALVELAVDDLDGVVDLIVLHADLVRDELHQQVDALDERRTAGDCARSR